MKAENLILKRLKKLRIRYARKHIGNSQKRCPENCVYNHEQVPQQISDDPIIELEMAPRLVQTVIVFQGNATVRYCTYGSDDPETWQGDICDRDETAEECSWFTPKISAEDAREEFLELLEDDDYVLKRYPDLAMLQWVLDDRLHNHELSWADKFILWIRCKISKPEPPRLLPPADDIPDDLWQ
jgi:hypothetical protein